MYQLYVLRLLIKLVFYNSLMKIKLNCDKENMLILNTKYMHFSNEDVANLTRFLIYLLIRWFQKQLCSKNFVKIAEIYP